MFYFKVLTFCCICMVITNCEASAVDHLLDRMFYKFDTVRIILNSINDISNAKLKKILLFLQELTDNVDISYNNLEKHFYLAVIFGIILLILAVLTTIFTIISCIYLMDIKKTLKLKEERKIKKRRRNSLNNGNQKKFGPEFFYSNHC